jgi:peptide deformylase
MALLPILTAPDPELKKISQPVKQVDAGIRKLMDDMLETMYTRPASASPRRRSASPGA